LIFDTGDGGGFWQRALDLFDEVGARKKLSGEENEVAVGDVDRITEGESTYQD
jgi:hypothetical protein